MAIPESETIIRVPKVFAYSATPSCVKCGHSASWPLRLALFLLGRGVHSYAYCPGDRNSKEVYSGGMFQIESPNTCFGIIPEHLHVSCGRCRYSWIMEVRPRKGF